MWRFSTRLQNVKKYQNLKKYFKVYIVSFGIAIDDCENTVYNVLDIDTILMTTFPNVIENVIHFVVIFSYQYVYLLFKERDKYCYKIIKRWIWKCFAVFTQNYIYYNYSLCICIVQDVFKNVFEEKISNFKRNRRCTCTIVHF